MASAIVTLEIGVRWWVIPYLRTVAFFATLTGCQPDFQKVAAFVIQRGLRLAVACRSPRRAAPKSRPR